MPRQPNTAINSRSVQPAFAILVAASLRRPCAEHCRKPASLQRVRNQLPKPLNENGAPNAVRRKVRFLRGTSLSACANSGANRHNQCQISAIEFDSDQCCSGLERLSCNRDGIVAQGRCSSLFLRYLRPLTWAAFFSRANAHASAEKPFGRSRAHVSPPVRETDRQGNS